MNFSEALELIKQGKRLANKGWNGKGMYVELQVSDENSKMTLPYIFMKTPCEDLVPWQPSQYDLLRGDWEEVA